MCVWVWVAAAAAQRFYDQCLALDPHDVRVLSNRSMACLALGQSLRALQDADKCLEVDRKWVKGYYRKGCALMALGEWGAAWDAFNGGLELEPSCDELVRGVGWCSWYGVSWQKDCMREMLLFACRNKN